MSQQLKQVNGGGSTRMFIGIGVRSLISPPPVVPAEHYYLAILPPPASVLCPATLSLLPGTGEHLLFRGTVMAVALELPTLDHLV